MTHIDRRHPEIGGAANPIRQQRDSSRVPNYRDWDNISDLSTTPLGRKYQRIRDNLDETNTRLHPAVQVCISKNSGQKHG